MRSDLTLQGKNSHTFSSAIIFDFDGVIIDSRELQKKALLESYSLYYKSGTPSLEEFFSHSGDSLENIFRKMGLATEMTQHYRDFCRKHLNEIKVFSGMQALLQTLKEHRFKCGLCTGKDRLRTLEILRYFNLTQFFEVVVCSDDVRHPKPHAESLLLAMKMLRVPHYRMIMIGDAKNDILCARNANVQSIGVTWGEYPFTLEDEDAPDRLVNTVNKLEDSIFEMAALNHRISGKLL